MKPLKREGPPRLAEMILGWLLQDEWETPLGDFTEYYNDLVHRRGSLYATWWYRGQVIKLLPVRLYEKAFWSIIMLKNYFKLAIRNLIKYPGYSFISISGLAVGLVCCSLIFLFVNHEVTYDAFHEKADRTYRVTTTETTLAGEKEQYATTFSALAPTLLDQIPEVELVSRMVSFTPTLSVDDQAFYAEHFFYADSSFFDVFSFPLLYGNAQEALTRPYTVVLSKEVAERYFGDANAIGKTLLLNNRNLLEVTAVFDELPSNTHIQVDFLASYATFNDFAPGYVDNNWRMRADYLYIVLKEGSQENQVEQKLPGLTEPHLSELSGRTNLQYDFGLQSLTSIHLHSKFRQEFISGGNLTSVYVLAIIALLILFIASINYINLSTARAADRAKEIGVRKVMGANRVQLTRQFLVESVLLAFAVALLAVPLLIISLPFFNTLTGLQLAASDLFTLAGLGLLVGVFVVGLLASGYPALFLSSLRAADSLRGAIATGPVGVRLRNWLVVGQFAISILLMISTAVIYNQIEFMRHIDLGYEKEDVIAVPIRLGRGEAFDSDIFKEVLEREASISRVAISGELPTQPVQSGTNNVRPEGSPEGESIPTFFYRVDADYISTVGLDVIQGRDFSLELASDSAAIIINEAAQREYGWMDPLGKQLFIGDEAFGHVIGVVRDFHYASPQVAVEPVILFQQAQPRFLLIRSARPDPSSALAATEAAWSQYMPGKPFSYFYLDDAYNALNRSEERLGSIIGIFTLIAIFMCGIGLFSLAAFSLKRRTKEIGVRKVLGASVENIVLLLSKDFLKLVLIGFLVASPVAYLIMNQWLNNFAYRTSVGAGTLIFVGLLTLALVLISTSLQAVNAALKDPVKTLRSE